MTGLDQTRPAFAPLAREAGGALLQMKERESHWIVHAASRHEQIRQRALGHMAVEREERIFPGRQHRRGDDLSAHRPASTRLAAMNCS